METAINMRRSNNRLSAYGLPDPSTCKTQNKDTDANNNTLCAMVTTEQNIVTSTITNEVEANCPKKEIPIDQVLWSSQNKDGNEKEDYG